MPEYASADGGDTLYVNMSRTVPGLLDSAVKFQLRSMAYCHELNWLYEKIKCCVVSAALLGQDNGQSLDKLRHVLSSVTQEAMAYKAAAREEGYAMFTALCKARMQCATLSACYVHLPGDANAAISDRLNVVQEFSLAVDALLPKQLLVIARLSHLLGLCEQMLHANHSQANDGQGHANTRTLAANASPADRALSYFI